MDIRGCQQTLHNPTTRSFISSLLETKPQKRLTADDALSQTFWQLQESDYETVRPAHLRNYTPSFDFDDSDLPDTASCGSDAKNWSASSKLPAEDFEAQ
jgi:serine/threonine protein kinase